MLAAGVGGACVVVLLVLWRWMHQLDSRTAAVVVVGDVGRSPRMCYHASSLLHHGWRVRLVGYFDTPLPDALQHARIQCAPLCRVPRWMERLPRMCFPLVALLKVPLTSLTLAAALLCPRAPAVVLVQTPPAIPTLLVARMVTALSGCRLLTDWHNLAYTLLGLKLGRAHPFVWLAYQLERWPGRVAHAHLFVTRAMRDVLVADWRLRGTTRVLYDRPGPPFRAVQHAEERATLRKRFAHTLHEERIAQENCALVVTSTSYTLDEDLGMLLDALSIYNRAAQQPQPPLQPRLPRIALVVTGKGPLRALYAAQFAARAQAERWDAVHTTLAWLASGDYPQLLRCVDVGISLHQSSSGLDLPMKVVDLLGCRTPVCALEFGCLRELIEPGRNGYVFSDAPSLAATLQLLLRGYPTTHHARRLDACFLPGACAHWQDNWDAVVPPLLPTPA